MILFLNFAPIEFMGGAEKMMLKMSNIIKDRERTVLVSVSKKIADFYGKLVLHRKFDNRIKSTTSQNESFIKLTFKSFIPLHKEWKKTRELFQNARIIYIKFELLETLIVIYFGGFKALRKTIAGIHTPLIYMYPKGFFDNLHTWLYESFLSKFILSRMKKVHVLTAREQFFLQKNFHLKNIVLIPNSLPDSYVKNNTVETIKNNLIIIFIGELSRRKGADILLDVIKNSPKEYIFHIVGDGPMKNEITDFVKTKSNCKIHGYINEDEVKKIYKQSDIIFIPSRAESMSLVTLEAMANGLKIVGSTEIPIDLPLFIKHANIYNKHEKYLELFRQIYLQKQNGKFFEEKEKIVDYFRENFTDKKIIPALVKEVFGLS